MLNLYDSTWLILQNIFEHSQFTSSRVHAFSHDQLASSLESLYVDRPTNMDALLRAQTVSYVKIEENSKAKKRAKLTLFLFSIFSDVDIQNQLFSL